MIMGCVGRQSTCAQRERGAQTRHYVTKHLRQVSASLFAAQWNGDQVILSFDAAIPIVDREGGFRTLAT